MKHTQLLIATVPSNPTPANVAELTIVKLSRQAVTISHVLNCNHTEPNITKFYITALLPLLMRTFA